jgi:hypothetical protein
MFTINIKSVTLLRTDHSPDYLFLHTDLPEGCFPYKDKATLRLEVAAGHGEKYLMDNFNVKPNSIIDIIC